MDMAKDLTSCSGIETGKESDIVMSDDILITTGTGTSHNRYTQSVNHVLKPKSAKEVHVEGAPFAYLGSLQLRRSSSATDPISRSAIFIKRCADWVCLSQEIPKPLDTHTRGTIVIVQLSAPLIFTA